MSNYYCSSVCIDLFFFFFQAVDHISKKKMKIGLGAQSLFQMMFLLHVKVSQINVLKKNWPWRMDAINVNALLLATWGCKNQKMFEKWSNQEQPLQELGIAQSILLVQLLLFAEVAIIQVHYATNGQLIADFDN